MIYTRSLALGAFTTLVVALVFFLGRNAFLQIFTTDPKVAQFAVIRLQVVCLFEFMTGIYEIPGGCMRGMNHSLTPALITILGSCVLRLVWIATFFQSHHTMALLLIVYPISWAVTGAAMNIAYLQIRNAAFRRLPDAA